MDNSSLYNCLQDRRFNAAPFGIIVRGILHFEAQCSNLVFSHVKRMGNRVAHCLAKLSKSCNSLIVWLEEVPHEAASFVIADKFAE